VHVHDDGCGFAKDGFGVWGLGGLIDRVSDRRSTGAVV
jgi:hypothetical protein